MPREIRRDPLLDARRRVAAPLAALLGVVMVIATPWWPAIRWVSLVSASGFLLALLSMYWPVLFYRCPVCRTRLRHAIWLPPVPDADGGSPLHALCSRCDIQWDTGVRGGGFGSD